MSQRSEKLHRQVEQLRSDVNELKETQRVNEKFYASLQAVMAQDSTQQMTAERRKTRQAQREARSWKLNAILALILAALAGGVALVVTVKADAAMIDAPDEPLPTVTVLSEVCLPDDIPTVEPEEPENELIEAALLARSHQLENVTVTHYDVCLKCCGKLDGITASGVQATPDVTVAVDPAVIPLGSDVLVDYGDGEIHYYRADDTGGAIKGSHIDLCVSSHEEALQLGVRTATVYWVAQEVE